MNEVFIKEPIIKCINVTKSFSNADAQIQKNQVLHGISLEIEEGDIVCIIGKSGSGKSTLLSILAGLDNASSGDIYNLGKRLNSMSSYEKAIFRQKNIGFVFQQFNLISQYTAMENVMLPLSFLGICKSEREEKAKQMLRLLGLYGIRNHRPSQMSGGEQQRIAIARALITNPRIIYADEPTGNLDSVNTQEIMNILCKQVKERQCTLVMITHDLSLKKFADKTITMQDGRIIKNEGESL